MLPPLPKLLPKLLPKTVHTLALALATLIAFPFTPPAFAAGNELVVGQLFDQSPAWIEAGRDYAGGAKTYFDVVNSEGGVNGKRIVYVTKDTDGSAAEIKRAADALLGESKADVLFGPIGDATLRALLDIKSADMQNVAIFGALTGIAATRNGVQILRANYADEARELLRHFKGLGLTSFCVVMIQTVDYLPAIRALREDAIAAGRPITCEIPIEESGRNAKAVAQAVRSKPPQAVIVLGDTSVLGNFAREFPFKEMGVLLGGLSLVNHTALTQIAGPAVSKGIVLTQVVPSPQREGVPIVREYARAMRKFRDEPPSHLSLEGFIAAKALVESLRSSLAGRPVRREDVLTILSRGTANPAASQVYDDAGMTSTKGGRPIDVTMVRGDGTLIR